LVIIAKAQYLFVDTSPMWMEKFIGTAKRQGMFIADATSGKEYDLRLLDDRDSPPHATPLERQW
jgi:hypothetical protein